MAESEPTQPMVQEDKKQLKYLDFVQVAVVYTVVCFASIYQYAKKNAGPLKPGVETVEGTVKTVTGPVYEKLHNVPFELLKFIDHKVDLLLQEMDRHVPSVMKQAPELARGVATEVQQTGLIETGTHLAKSVFNKYEPTAKKLYNKYEPFAEHYAVSAWHSLHKLPLFPQVASIMVPAGVYWAEKYNKTVCYAADRDFAVAAYMPLVPVEKIGKIFEGERGHEVAGNRKYIAVEE